MREIDHIEPLPKAKKPVLIFSCADKNNFPYAVLMLNSLTKFHKPPEVDIVLYTDETDKEKLKQLPKGIQVEDLTPFLQADPMFFYRQKPVVAERYIKDYELVLGLDADQIITGSLDYIFNTTDYDVIGVLNYNASDAQTYGVVQGWGIHPLEYMNCGLVGLRSEKFTHDWKVWCFSNQFDRLQYKEQDGLNALVYHGNWNVRILDHFDGVAGMRAWWGLFAKTWWIDAEMKDGKVVIPKVEGDKIRNADTELKVIHFAGGNRPNKFNYKTLFSDEVGKYLDTLIAPTK